MMLSLPLLPPQEDHTTSLRPSYRPRAASPPPSLPASQNAAPHANHRQQRLQRDDEKRLQHARSPLALLAADEAAIAARKAAIRNFGAFWIRPPGIPKTLQAMNEEEVERREQEELERQERGMLDLQAQQQAEEARLAAAEGEGEEGEERDLDDEIPDAQEGEEDEEDVTGDVTADVTADVTFNEDSMLEGSLAEQQEQEQYADLEEAELTGAARDEEDLGIERDLDDDVPDAGSYQHTDTELEDSSSSSSGNEDSPSILQDSFAQQSARRSARVSQMRQAAAATMTPPAMLGGLHERMRAQVAGAESLPRSPGSLNLSSSVLENSFVGSSPMMQRGARGRGGAARRRGGRMS